MSGRRLRNVLENTATQIGEKVEKFILAGLSNMYTSYITTPEEYDLQRYEAASTIYGRHTLTIYLAQYENLSNALFQNISLQPGPEPPLLGNKVISLTPPVFFDSAPLGKHFGDVVKQPNIEYKVNEQVQVQFVSGNPRNNLLHERSYLTVEKHIEDKNWTIIATDADWETL